MADYRDPIPFIKAVEGGLSRNPKDSAAKDPAPWSITAYDIGSRKVVTASDWHTNKGITHTVFKANAAKHGYAYTKENFVNMPDSIWIPLYKQEYWDHYIKGDKVQNQGVANLLVDWAWGSGTWAVKNLQQVLKRPPFNYTKMEVDGVMGPDTLSATNAVEQHQLFELLDAEKRDYYRQVVEHNPDNAAFLKGWLIRADKLVSANKKYFAAGGLGLLFFWDVLWPMLSATA